MSNFARKFNREHSEKEKAPRCHGHMFMNKYGLWQCKKCGRQKFPIGTSNKEAETTEVIPTEEVAQIIDVPSESVSEVTE